MFECLRYFSLVGVVLQIRVLSFLISHVTSFHIPLDWYQVEASATFDSCALAFLTVLLAMDDKESADQELISPNVPHSTSHPDNQTENPSKASPLDLFSFQQLQQPSFPNDTTITQPSPHPSNQLISNDPGTTLHMLSHFLLPTCAEFPDLLCSIYAFH